MLLILFESKIKIDYPPTEEQLEDDLLAFGIYLLGHDWCAEHEICFSQPDEKQRVDIHWKGKIALIYSGDSEFKYTFEAQPCLVFALP